MPSLTDPVVVALVGAGGIAFGALLSTGAQLWRWRTGEQKESESQAIESYANANSATAEAYLKLITELRQVRSDLNSALERIDALEKERKEQDARLEEQDTRILKLEAEKLDLQERVHELETENAQLRRRTKNRKGLAVA